MTEYVLKDDPNGARFTLISAEHNPKAEPGCVSLYPSGGGFHMSVPEDEFKTLFEPAPPRKWRAGFFTLDGAQWVLPGYTNDRHWNGWEVPYFDREVVNLLMRLTNTDPEFVTHFWVGDKLAYTDGQYPDEPACEFDPKQIEVDGQTITVWDFGDGWTWNEVTE